MTVIPDHYCPSCGAACKSFPRYAWHFCNDCCERAKNRSGRLVECSNVGMSGGFQWRYQGEEKWMICRGLYCFIANRDVYLTEARFGGIVAQPLLSHQSPDDIEAVDIRRD